MLKIESGHMFIAIDRNDDGPKHVGYLNKITGEIVFVGDVGDTAAWMGKDCAAEMVFDRADVEANPQNWIEIPKYPYHIYGRDGKDKFITEFLAEHGLEGELV